MHLIYIQREQVGIIDLDITDKTCLWGLSSSDIAFLSFQIYLEEEMVGGRVMDPQY